MKCQRNDCPAPATAAVVVNIPAVDHVVSEHDPIKMITGTRLCQEHALKFDVAEFIRMNPNLTDIAQRLCKANQKAEPDMARAFVTALAFDTDEWRAFCGMEATKDTSGAGRILAERRRQVIEERYLPDHDEAHDAGELGDAAVCYAVAAAMPRELRGDVPDAWPWDTRWWKPVDDEVRMLVKAGALIAAEIDRLLKLQWNEKGTHGPGAQ